MGSFSNVDEFFMKRAIELAKNGRNATKSNPMVGAVIVKDREILGEGYHKKFGGPHAEIEAINSAKIDDFRGATIYVSLEPCCHIGKTPPCSEKLIEKGFERVVIASVDPNPTVSGKGINRLKEAGLKVDVGILDKEQKHLNEKYIYYIKEKMPFVMMKAAVTLDGKIAAKSGDSKWISSGEARAYTRKMRGEYQAIMVGIGTVLADDPKLTAEAAEENPLKIVVDPSLKIPLNSYLVKNAENEPLLIITSVFADAGKKKKLEEFGIDILEAPLQADRLQIDSLSAPPQINEENRRIDLRAALKRLAEIGISSIFLEGGGGLNFEMITNSLVNKFTFVLTPKILGGKDAISAVEGLGINNVADAVKLKNMQAESFGEEIIITAYLKEE